jgi:hypothetical protein
MSEYRYHRYRLSHANEPEEIRQARKQAADMLRGLRRESPAKAQAFRHALIRTRKAMADALFNSMSQTASLLQR